MYPITEDPSSRQRSHSFGGRVPSRKSSHRRSNSGKRSTTTNSVVPNTTSMFLTGNSSNAATTASILDRYSPRPHSAGGRTHSYDQLDSISQSSRSRSSTSFSTASNSSFNSDLLGSLRYFTPDGSLATTTGTLPSDQISFHSVDGLGLLGSPDSTEFIPNYFQDGFRKSPIDAILNPSASIRTSFI